MEIWPTSGGITVESIPMSVIPTKKIHSQKLKYVSTDFHILPLSDGKGNAVPTITRQPPLSHRTRGLSMSDARFTAVTGTPTDPAQQIIGHTGGRVS